jgi:hypothetical protein
VEDEKRRIYPNLKPSLYARGKLPMLRGRYAGELGKSVAKYGSHILPGIPETMLVGFTSNTEGATEVVGVSQGKKFYECGYYNTPMGIPSDIANQRPRPCIQGGSNNAYWNAHANALTVKLLGRPARTEYGQWQTDIDGQVVCGIQDYRSNGRSKNNTLVSGAKAVESSLWFAWLCKMGFTGGNFHLGTIGPKIADSNQNKIPGNMIRYYAEGYADGSIVPGPALSYSNTAFTLVRAWNAIACAKALCISLGQDPSFYDMGLSTHDQNLFEDVITRAAAGMDVSQASADLVVPPYDGSVRPIYTTSTSAASQSKAGPGLTQTDKNAIVVAGALLTTASVFIYTRLLR